MNIFQILLASNSDADKHVVEAIKRLQTEFPIDIRFSDVLESCAVKNEGHVVQDSFPYLNVICLAQTELPMDKVQMILKAMETEMGRKRGTEAKGVVTIDLDLVLWNGENLRPWDVAQAYYQNCLKSLRSY
jgi:2-amino-4-hydroxy-6-hydroxymethyldihydropteridine diphosphokinase